MKKAKILLTVIAVFGIVGGALAYKAHTKRLGNWFCTTSTLGSTYCPVLANTTNNMAAITQYCTDIAEDPCTIKHRVVTNL